MRCSLLLVPVLLALGGCFESYEAALSATASNATVAWSVTQGFGPTVTFRIANDDTDSTVTNMKVRARVDVISGGGILDAADPELVTPVPGMSGTAGDYVIDSLTPGEAFTLALRVDCEPGVYRWTVTIDPDQQVEEYNERNNTTITTVTVTQPGLGNVNLAFGDLSDLTAVPDGEDILLGVPVVVTRTGAVPLPLVRIDMESEGVGANYFFLVPNLAVGETTLDLQVIAPAGGVGQIAIILDPSDFIPETDEDDNVLIFDFPLGGSN